ncbi:DUF1127 domain-containing protein [Pseudomonas sp. v388]|uniref:DUF1127 domain-containing protein n=1 Tax=Pseudomonas sp. v388 TaxID=2479849 RepID=UPI000F776F45|nr:DUF1127 domain-containing protein [Pseudomonas sp. v388]RRV07002.1 DUF1127 domain-containing protein [Pseudomonas sp. v388]
MMKGQKGYVLAGQPTAVAFSSGLWTGLKYHFNRWMELHRQRRLLAQLSDEALRDLGLSRADIMQESERPFWDDPLKH